MTFGPLHFEPRKNSRHEPNKKSAASDKGSVIANERGVILSAASRGSFRDAQSKDLLPQFSFFAALGIFLITSASAAPNQTRIPAVHGITFSDTKVDLPDALHGKVGILVVGFSQGSRDAVTTWGKKLATDYYDSPNVLYYEMPCLASVPKLLRGFVAGRIKASVSDRGKPHFLPLTDDEAQWRDLTRYNAPDDPYILLVDGAGTVRWQTQGPPTDSTYAALKQQVDSLRPH